MSHGGGGMAGHGGGMAGHGMVPGGHQSAHQGLGHEHYQHYQHERHLAQSSSGLTVEGANVQRAWIVRLMSRFRRKKS